MQRAWHSVPVAVAAALVLAVGDVGVANVQYNFNSTAEGWEFGTILPPSGTSPYWQQVQVSSTAGALQSLLVESGSGAGAWAMSPCLVVTNAKDVIHVDISHFTAFPQGILGQVQFRIDATGTGFGGWQGISGTSWLTYADNHVPPTEANVFPPLLTSSTSSLNEWLAFSGTHNATTDPSSATTGQHVASAFDIGLTEYGLATGSEIQFRLVVGVNDVFTPPLSPPTVLWEVNDVQIIGVKECVVPEPGTLALAGSAIGCGFVGLARRRRRRGGQAAPCLLH